MSNNGPPRNVAQGMARLKELLFDNEVETLSELEKRLHSIEAVNNQQTQRVDQLFQRAGTEERFRSSVAVVLDKALQDAELRNHAELSRAMAPLVVGTIKTELKNSQDDLVEIMFPITGRMVKSYVQSEMKKLSSSVNKQIDNNPVMLRVRSLTSGKPVSDLAIADSQRLSVDEIFLIRRGSGELVGHWPPSSTTMSNADVHMSGVLDAINDFASSAFEDDGGHFKSFGYEDFQVYMRASPVYLLAAKCTGVAPSGIESIFDDAFLGTMERVAALEKASGANGREVPVQTRSLELHPLAETVETQTSEIYDDLSRSSIGGAVIKGLLFLIAVPLLAWFFWGLYTDAEEGMARRTAQQVIRSTEALRGYKTHLDVGYRGKSITVSGLAPDKAALTALTTGLVSELPNAKINAEMAVIPTKRVELVRERIAPAPTPAPIVQKVDTAALEARLNQRVARAENQMIAASARRAVKRANTRLGQALPELDRLETQLKSGVRRVQIRKARAELKTTIAGINELREKLDQKKGDMLAFNEFVDPLNQSTRDVARTLQRIAGIHGGGTPSSVVPKPVAKTLADSAEDLASQAERMATLVLALNETAAMIPEPVPPPPAIVTQSPSVLTAEDRLRLFAERNAIFFANGTDFTSAELANDILNEAMRLIKATNNLVRVVGYTDEQGRSSSNITLAQQRADAVVEELVRRGVPRARLVGVGRSGWFYLSPGAGVASPNRRVQFEVGFRGEARASQ